MSLTPLAVVAMAALAAWVYLAAFHGRFWRADQRLDAPLPRPESWPAVAMVIPARNEAATIGRAVSSLLAQDYAGALALVVVDDGSSDGTAQAAQAAAQAAKAGRTARSNPDMLRTAEPEPGGPQWVRCRLSRSSAGLPLFPYKRTNSAESGLRASRCRIMG